MTSENRGFVQIVDWSFIEKASHVGCISLTNDIIKVFIGLLFPEALKQIRIGAILGVLTCGVRIANRTACRVSIPLCNYRSIPLCIEK